ncbi:hypothetical protein Leryth_007969 [Lithospermum erythrorhizon]|nr:hypothetical protein Leryth_007969 [Lithospermum erythrorhizon]
MEKTVISSLLLFTIFSVWCSQAQPSTTQELIKGFKATPNENEPFFHSLLTDSYGNYSFGFLRINKNQLTLGVIHVKSAETIWTTNLGHLAKWAGSTDLFFNGSLVLLDNNGGGVLWSTHTDGGRVWLSNNSNLQVQKLDDVSRVYSTLWQSFNFPSDTLVENQNFTSDMLLYSSNGVYSMRLGSNFFGLYANFNPGLSRTRMYFKHKALEAKASVVEGKGPIYAVLSSDGYLGMYQNGSSVPIDVESFISYQEPGVGVRRLKLESDGNLKGYYWTGSNWIEDYKGIHDPCQLPSGCGSYGLCRSGKGCSCLDNGTDYSKSNGQCVSNDNKQGDFCSTYSHRGKFKVLRIVGVELPNKELVESHKMESLKDCENACQVNCTCWGAVYSNSSGFCYILDYPIQTLVSVGDDTKVGYFKERVNNGTSKIRVGLGIALAILFGLILLISGIIIGWRCYRTREGKRGVKMFEEEDGVVGVGPYKGLRDESFRSIELSER